MLNKNATLPRPKLKATSKRKPLTKEERDIAKAKKQQRSAKIKLNIAQRKLAKIANVTEDDEIKEKATESLPETYYKQDEVRQEVLFKPNPGPQTEFLAAPEREVLYGGAAGGGKTFSLIVDPLRYCNNSNMNGLILRRTNDELREIIHKSQELYPKAFPGAKWMEKKSQWTFPSGARIWMTYLEQEKDVLRYQGQAFTYIGFDELTQYPTSYAWDYLRSRLRTADTSLPVYMRGTTNPGGPGHQWVKKMFIDPAPENKAFWATDITTGETLKYPKGHSKENEPLFKRRFIPAKLVDNPFLYEQGDYEAMLLSLPETQRRQLLEGSWDVAEGAAFAEFDRRFHTIEPFQIPDTWRKFRACDYGYSSYSAVLWFAVDPATEQLFVYREMYVTKYTAKDLAYAILEAEKGDGQISYGVLDSSCWHKRGDTGPSLAEQMISVGCRWRPSDRSRGSRIAGKNEIHRRLKVDELTEEAGLVIFNTCTNLVAQLPIIPLDKTNSEDIDTKAEDHLYDALRYGIMTRPRSRSIFDYDPAKIPQTWNPADKVFGY
jgi:hypothetical protein